MSGETAGTSKAALSDWTRTQVAAGGWVRRMFAEGERLRAEHGADAVLDLALGQPLGEPPRAVLEALHAAVDERTPRRHGYMPNLGFPEVRERLARDVDHPGMRGDCIAVTSGAGAALSLALRATVDAGDEVLGIVPFFGEYSAYCAAVGARFVAVAAAVDFGLDLDAVAAALSPRTAAIILNSPCNPSGHVTAAGELAALASLLSEHARRTGREPVLIVDEVYFRMLYAPAVRVEPFPHYARTLLARSFSKDLGLAGERIGYLAVHPQLATQEFLRGLEVCQRALGFVNAPATMQRMLLHLDGFPVDIDAHRVRRDHALQAARAAGLNPIEPEGGLYLWMPAPWRDGLAFVQALAERRILVAPGIAFGAPQWMRVCISATEDVLSRALATAGELAELEQVSA